ncbi:hypothetical protein G6F35_016296 [Rhizopus arrhizus]|nr:hypothetical protein G6F35_016296 [Rhizopus arrhizus]
MLGQCTRVGGAAQHRQHRRAVAQVQQRLPAAFAYSGFVRQDSQAWRQPVQPFAGIAMRKQRHHVSGQRAQLRPGLWRECHVQQRTGGLRVHTLVAGGLPRQPGMPPRINPRGVSHSS